MLFGCLFSASGWVRKKESRVCCPVPAKGHPVRHAEVILTAYHRIPNSAKPFSFRPDDECILAANLILDNAVAALQYGNKSGKAVENCVSNASTQFVKPSGFDFGMFPL